MVILLLSSILTTPTYIRTKYSKYKPTVADCRQSILLLIKSENDLNLALERMRQRYADLGLRIQPIILAIGNDWNTVKEFQVRINNVSYSFSNFLKALDIVFKAHHVFYISYAHESYLIWLFLQKYIFQINLKSDKYTPTSSAFIADLETIILQ